ncbi:hypothetical protein JCM6882_008836 [Rhodosporidiobolus microsporus]
MPLLRPRSLSAHHPAHPAGHFAHRHFDVSQLPRFDAEGLRKAMLEAQEEAVEFEEEDEGDEEEEDGMDLDEVDEGEEEEREKELRTYWSENDVAAGRRQQQQQSAARKEAPLTLAQRRGVGVVSIVKAERRKLELELGRAKLVLRSPSSPRGPPSLRSSMPATLRKTRSSSLRPSPLSPLSAGGGNERRWARAMEGSGTGG